MNLQIFCWFYVEVVVLVPPITTHGKRSENNMNLQFTNLLLVYVEVCF